MENDDEANDQAPIEPNLAPQGPRRSTFTPPTADEAGVAHGADVHDDDELANALAADLGFIATGAIPVIPPGSPVYDLPPAPPVYDLPVAPPVYEAPPAPPVYDLPPAPPVYDVTPAPPTYDAPPPTYDAPPAPPTYDLPPAPPVYDLPVAPPSAYDGQFEAPPAPSFEFFTPPPPPAEPTAFDRFAPPPPPMGEPAAFDPFAPPAAPVYDLSSGASHGEPAGEAAEVPAWMSLPAPDPTQAVNLGEGPPAPPTRRSLRDDELIGLADEAAREPGGALSAIEQLEAELKLRDEEARELSEWEATAQMPEAPVVVPPTVVPDGPAPLPAWDVPAPSESWDPGPDFGMDDPDPALAAPLVPPALVEPPPFGGPPILPSEAAARAHARDSMEIVEAEIVEDAAAGALAFGAASTAAGAAAPPREFSFEDLLVGGEASPAPVGVGAPGSSFIEPLPVVAGEGVPTDTGSVAIVDRAYEPELVDDVDYVDRIVLGTGVAAVGTSVLTGPVELPSGPISTHKIPEDEVVLIDNEPIRQKAFSLEKSGSEPTPVDHRVGRAARLFWLWFAANSSILSVGLGATVFAVGMSLRQSIVAILAGVALSFIPLGLTTLAGKRSGQPTMIVSRATFGVVGNVVPAILALVTRVFWGAALLWLLASSVAIVLVGGDVAGPFGEREILLISLAAGFVLAVLIAFAGYPMIARIQLVLSVISAVLIVGLIAMTAEYIDVATALTTPDGSWLLTITGAVLVFSFVGLVWANGGADLARYQRPESSGATSMLWATFGATLPAFALIGYGALLAASNEGIATGFLVSPLDTLALMLPTWYPVPLIAATTLSLLSGIVVTLYSGGFALQAIGVRVRRQWATVIVATLLAGMALLLAFGVTGINELFRDAATTLAVPTAAWAGIFAAETMIRNRRYESESLTKRGGVYASIRWVNLVGLFVISAIGFGLTTATIAWLGWQGYGFGLLGVPLDSDLATSDVGVLVALALGILLPIVAGIPAIRKQEAARV